MRAGKGPEKRSPVVSSVLTLTRFPVCSPRTCQPSGRWWVSVMHGSVPSKPGESLSLFFLQGDVSLSGLSICLSIHCHHPVGSKRLLR